MSGGSPAGGGAPGSGGSSVGASSAGASSAGASSAGAPGSGASSAGASSAGASSAASEDAALARRLRSQLLTDPASPRDAVAVTAHLLAVQAQDPRGARLAIRARTDGVTAADIDRELTDRRTLLITWCNRGTLHLIRSEDYPLLQALTTPQLRRTVARRLDQEGVSPDLADRGVALIDRALADTGPLTRARLRERLERAGIPVAGQAIVHLLVRASLDGVIVRGPMAGAEQAFVRVDDWLHDIVGPGQRGGRGGRPRGGGGAGRAGGSGGRGGGEAGGVDRTAALAELARRYLAGHAPASARDLARWAGITLGDARAGLGAIGRELRAFGEDGLVELAAAPGAGAKPAGGGPGADPGSEEWPAPRLLGAFEPLLMGWTSRAGVLGPGGESAVVSGGVFRSFALVDGRAAAVWRFTGSRGALRIELQPPFRRISSADRAALERDAEAVLRFLS